MILGCRKCKAKEGVQGNWKGREGGESRAGKGKTKKGKGKGSKTGHRKRREGREGTDLQLDAAEFQTLRA